MKENLVQYVNLLFAGTSGCEDVRDEILQNTLDRYDDLISQGKSPEAAYQLAISGIGDLREIMGEGSATLPPVKDTPILSPEYRKKKANSIALYILSPIPLFLMSELGFDVLGLCLTLIFIAVATAQLISIRQPAPDVVTVPTYDPHRKLRESINYIIWVVGVIAYMGLSFATGAWEITWVMFPLIGAVQGLVGAILDNRKGI